MNPPPHGVDAQGEDDKKSLTKHGWERADALVDLFNPKAASPRAGLLVPASLFAASTDGDGSQRPVETITPLAYSFRPRLRIDASIAADETGAIADAPRAASGTVLVAWKHERITEIGQKLAPAATLPATWPDDTFDVVWVFDKRNGSYACSQTPQQLLCGDQDVGIT